MDRHYVKRYMTERWFCRVVGPLGRSYITIALQLKVKPKCWKDRARNQSDCGIKTFILFISFAYYMIQRKQETD